MPIYKLPLELDLINESHIADTHNALASLKLVPKVEKNVLSFDDSLKNAVKTFKQENDLGNTASLTPSIIQEINLPLHYNFIVSNKGRGNDLHTTLEERNMPIDKTEKVKKGVGDSTRDNIISFQKVNYLPQDDKVIETFMAKLDSAFIKKKNFQQKYKSIMFKKTCSPTPELHKWCRKLTEMHHRMARKANAQSVLSNMIRAKIAHC